MRILILYADYPEFLNALQQRHPRLAESTYDEQVRTRAGTFYGSPHSYRWALEELGHTAMAICINSRAQQAAWARENGIVDRRPRGVLPLLRQAFGASRSVAARVTPAFVKKSLPEGVRTFYDPDSWSYTILAEEIRSFSPDVVLNLAMGEVDSRFLGGMKPHIPVLVGQIASPLPVRRDFACYDLILSSLPHFVEYFRGAGVAAELQRLAFDPRVLDVVRSRSPIPASFVGSLFPVHRERVDLLEELSARVEIEIWGSGSDSLPESSPIRPRLRDPVWGLDMYAVLQASRVTLNHHIDVAAGYANNLRLFEATGVGTCLLTDWKSNLAELFEPEVEVVTYRSAAECEERLRYLLENEPARAAIAAAGQRRTLREHSYLDRGAEMTEIFERTRRSRSRLGSATRASAP